MIIAGGIRQIPQCTNAGEYIQTSAQLGYGVFAVLLIASVVAGHWIGIATIGWLISVPLAAGLATVPLRAAKAPTSDAAPHAPEKKENE